MSNFCLHHIFSETLVNDINGIGSVLLFTYHIMVGRVQFQIVDKVCVCVTYIQMDAVSFVTLVCNPSMSVIIADLAKRTI